MDCCILPMKQYLTDAPTLENRIKRIDQLIDAMLLSTLDVVSSDDYSPNVSEYQLNDGQMTVKTGYRSVNDVQKGIMDLERIKQTYMNQLNGRVVVLRDIKSLNRIR